MKLSFKLYAFCSLNALLALIGIAIVAHESLYYALHFLCTERISVAILTNFAFMVFLGVARLFVSIFLGPLRDFEVEQVFEVGRGFLLDTVMFLVLSSPTIDDEEVSTRHILQFVGFVVVFKLFHVIAQTRVAHFFESRMGNGRHLFRLLGLLIVLACVDIVAVRQFFKWSRREASLYLWLFFECVGMTASSLMNFAKFCLRYIDNQTEGGWPGFGTTIFFLNVVSDVLSLGIFLVFMIVFIISHPSRLPIHMTSDIILVGKALFLKLRSFQCYRQLVREMTKRFPEATVEELELAETCIICRDSLYMGSRKLPCGHVFHVECLKAWFVQQQSCPMCRANVFQSAAAESRQEVPRSTTDQHNTQETFTQSATNETNTSMPYQYTQTPHFVVYAEHQASSSTECRYPIPLNVDGQSNSSHQVLGYTRQETCTNTNVRCGDPHNTSVSLHLNPSNQCVYIVCRKVNGQIVSSTYHVPQIRTQNRPVANFFRRLLSCFIPYLALDRSPQVHYIIQSHIPQVQRPVPKHKQTLAHCLIKSMKRKRYSHAAHRSPSSRYLLTQKVKLQESLDDALKLSEFFRQQSLYWLERAQKNSPCCLPFQPECLPPSLISYPFNSTVSKFSNQEVAKKLLQTSGQRNSEECFRLASCTPH